MKTVSTALFSSFIVSIDAAGFRDLVEKVTRNDSIRGALYDAADDAAPSDDGRRDLSAVNGCWVKTPAAAWHPTYIAGWTNGFCRFTVDCNSPSFSTELDCCKGAYAGQISGHCLAQLPSPPTMAPTEKGGLDVYYPDYNRAWPEGVCINARPLPSGRPTYNTMLTCCQGAYRGQVSGKCLSDLPAPPTTSPTTFDMDAGFWYADYDTPWSEAGCKNTLPLPFNNPNDRPNYQTQLDCCKKAYAGQMSGVCLSRLPTAPTSAPTGSGGLDYWYPDYETPWSRATCKNDRPAPFAPGGRPKYDSQSACCKGAYAGQVSGSCLAALPHPPTQSPTESGGLDVFYPLYEHAWPYGHCTNTRPLPSGRPAYSSKESCCSGAYGGQLSDKCMCDAVGVCYSCKCGTQAERDAAGCSLQCS